MKTAQTAKILAALVGLFTASWGAHAQYTFSALDYPQAGSFGTYATGISESNIVGYYYGIGNSGPHGFVYDGSSYTSLDFPGATGTYAYGISGSTVVGRYYDASGYHGFAYDGANFADFEVPGAIETRPQGMYGTDIVGSYRTGTYWDGFVYDGNTFSFFDDPLGGYGTLPNGICDTNVVGTYFTQLPSTTIPHGFLDTDGTFVTLDAPGAGGGTIPSAVYGTNIVGSFLTNRLVPQYQGFIYSGGKFTTLNAPQGVKGTRATGIWGATIVGSFTDAAGTSHGFFATPASTLVVPSLTIVGTGNSVSVSWPYPSSGWTLEQSADPGAATWAASGGITNDGTNNLVTITSSGACLFFRLSHPPL